MANRSQASAPVAGPFWLEGVDLSAGEPLRGNERADTCVVGAGIAGLTTAYLLASAGQSVAVLEDGKIASGMTEYTSAHLSNAIDAGYAEIERMHGEAGSRVVAESHSAAIDLIESIVERESIDCDFKRVDGYLFCGPSDTEERLDEDLAAAARAGLGVTKVGRAPLDHFDTGPCIRFPRQAQFHPLKYMAGLARAFVERGGRLFTKSHVESVEGGRAARATVGPHVVNSEAIVVTTNVPVNDLVAIHTKQAAYMTYVIGVRIPRGSVEHALYWDTDDPYHYIRVHPKNQRYDLLIVGGEDHRSGQADDTSERYARIEGWTRERFPMVEQTEFIWAGQVMQPNDGIAFIGHNPLDANNVFVATGDAGMGLTHGTIAGILLSDLILGRTNDWASVYDPSRKPVRALGEFLKEAANTAAQYADWVTPGEVNSPDEIAKDSGAVMRDGLTKVAIYRDEKGKLHRMSAVCTHLGCIVQWNDATKTWDCPCHGSKFNKLGEVKNGPANSALPRLDE